MGRRRHVQREEPRLAGGANQLGPRALGEGERHRSRGRERDAERVREHPGHGPADSTSPLEPGRARAVGSGPFARARRRARCPCRRGRRDDVVRVRHADELDPRQDQHDAERDAQGALRHLDREARPDQDARDRPDEEPGHGVGVDITVEEVRSAGDPEEHGRVEHVGADDLLRGERVGEQHREPEERARADRGEADDETAERADHDRDRLVARPEQERCIARMSLDVGLREEPEPADDQRTADDLLQQVHVVVADPVRQLDPDQRHRGRAEQHPRREAGVDGAEHAVARGAERFEDRPVEDVGADGDFRVEAEEEDQDRRHQAPATHSGHPDEDSDQQAGERELPGHTGFGGSGQETKGLPVIRQPSLYASQPVQKPVTAASSASAATSSPRAIPRAGRPAA